MPLTRAQPVTQALLTRALDRTPLDYTRDSDGDPYAFIAGAKPGQGLQCWVLLECRAGQAYQIFKLTSLVRPVIPWQNLPDALLAANRYNETHRFGKLYVAPADDPQNGVSLRFEGELDVSDGVTAEFLSTYAVSHIASICAFLSQLFEDDQLFATPPSKPNRKNGKSTGRGK
jgi:hypothetical protein